jgi:hypothetical protein
LHRAADLFVAPDDGIQLSGSGQLGQVRVYFASA